MGTAACTRDRLHAAHHYNYPPPYPLPESPERTGRVCSGVAGGQSANETSRPTAGRVITGTRSRVHEEELKKKREGGEKGREEGRKEGVSGEGVGTSLLAVETK